MKLDYFLFAALVGALYALVKNFLPDFPVSEEVFQLLIGYLLVKLGIEVVKPALESFKARFR